jgi:hypothetical protein
MTYVAMQAATISTFADSEATHKSALSAEISGGGSAFSAANCPHKRRTPPPLMVLTLRSAHARHRRSRNADASDTDAMQVNGRKKGRKKRNRMKRHLAFNAGRRRSESTLPEWIARTKCATNPRQKTRNQRSDAAPPHGVHFINYCSPHEVNVNFHGLDFGWQFMVLALGY